MNVYLKIDVWNYDYDVKLFNSFIRCLNIFIIVLVIILSVFC